MRLLYLVLVCVFNESAPISAKPRVCKTFEGYYLNKGCYFNSDYVLELPNIIRKYGYQVQTFSVTTQDGYILQVFRIPSNSDNSTPVFLQHGVYLSAISFVNTGKQSLGFVLADAGYDIWLGNFRGNRYGKKHVNLREDDPDFWKFSFHEMGIYDVRAQLDLVRTVTNKSVVYIGYSMGATVGFVYSTVNQDLAKNNIRAMISLAAVAYLTNIPSILRFLAPIWPGLEKFFNTLHHGEIAGRKSPLLDAVRKICASFPHKTFICQIPVQLMFGPDTNQWNPETLPITLLQNGDSISTKTITHFKQIMESSRFQQFDYGVDQNMVKYNSVQPPLYNFTRIQVPVYLIYARNDYLSTERNANRLYQELPTKAKAYGKYVVPYEKFNHADFISGKDVKTLLYDHLLLFLENLCK